MASFKSLVFFVDLDNTLLDNERLKHEIEATLKKTLGTKSANNFWKYYEKFRYENGFIDVPLIIQRYLDDAPFGAEHPSASAILQRINYEKFLFKDALKVLDFCNSSGTLVLFTGGNVEYQNLKIEKCNLKRRTNEVLVAWDKLLMLDEIKKKYPDQKLVFIDDNPKTLIETKEAIPQALTVLVKQGYYSKDYTEKPVEIDIIVNSINEVRGINFDQYLED